MPVTIDKVMVEPAESGDPGARRFVAAPCELSDLQLQTKPVEYGLLADTAITLVALASRVFRWVKPGSQGHLASDDLQQLLQQSLDRIVLDEPWLQLHAEGFERQLRGTLRRSFLAVLNDAEERQQELHNQAEQQARRLRGRVLDEVNLIAAVEELLHDGFLSRPGGGPDQVCLPGDEDLREGMFHGEVVRQAVLEHLAEVRGWALPSPTPSQAIEHACEHSRILGSASPSTNSMLRDGLRTRLQERLTELGRAGETRRELLLAPVLELAGVPLSPSRVIDFFALTDQLLPAVLEPENVARVLRQMASDGELIRLTAADRQVWLVDPEFYAETQDDPALAEALDRFLGVLPESPDPAPVTAPPVNNGTAPAAAHGGDVRARLRLLRDLVTEDLITEADYERRKNAILDEV